MVTIIHTARIDILFPCKHQQQNTCPASTAPYSLWLVDRPKCRGGHGAGWGKEYWFDTTLFFATLASEVRIGCVSPCGDKKTVGGKSMKTRPVIIAALLALCSATGAQALDRDAKVISQIGVDYCNLGKMNSTRLTVWDETGLDFEREWAIVAGLGVGQLSGSVGTDKPSTFFLALGSKWYPLATTSVQLLGTAEWADSGDQFRVLGGTVGLEQRFITKQAAVSPFLTASASLQDTRADLSVADANSFTCLVLKGGVGCDFIVRSDFTIVFHAEYTDSRGPAHEPLGDYADGWGGSVALKYLWF